MNVQSFILRFFLLIIDVYCTNMFMSCVAICELWAFNIICVHIFTIISLFYILFNVISLFFYVFFLPINVLCKMNVYIYIHLHTCLYVTIIYNVIILSNCRCSSCNIYINLSNHIITWNKTNDFEHSSALSYKHTMDKYHVAWCNVTLNSDHLSTARFKHNFTHNSLVIQ